jgi:hypothetical protein
MTKTPMFFARPPEDETYLPMRRSRKLVPCGIEPPKFSAMVWPISPSVERVRKFVPSALRGV